jgi:hypothetical protein
MLGLGGVPRCNRGVRAAATSLLARLARHRQRGADLVFEAYQVDVGGET